MRITATRFPTPHLFQWLQWKRLTTPSVDPGVEKLDLTQKRCGIWKMFGQFLTKLKICYLAQQSLCWLFTQEMKRYSHTNSYTWVFVAALFLAVKGCRHPNVLHQENGQAPVPPYNERSSAAKETHSRCRGHMEGSLSLYDILEKDGEHTSMVSGAQGMVWGSWGLFSGLTELVVTQIYVKIHRSIHAPPQKNCI